MSTNASKGPSAFYNSGPLAPVPKDLQPSVDRIDDLARRILSSDILLPKFQRDFVWNKKQIRDLLDSIANNYPIGSVLLWQSRQELRSESRIAGLNSQLPRPDYPVNYLLDGQQRLSSICGALYWDGDDPNSQWNIVYDLRNKTFHHLDTMDDPPLHQIRLNKLSNPADYFQHVSMLDSLTANDKATMKDNANTLFNRFKDYKVAVVTLGDMSLDDVAPIFERINSTGTPLTIVDLMRAATWSREFDLIDAIEGILKSLSEKGFGGIDRKALLRNISAAAGGDFSATSIDNLRKHSAERLNKAASEVSKSYERMVDFLSTQLHIPADALVPYVNQLVVLAEAFRMIERPSASQYVQMQQWFWKTAVAGYFGGWNTAMMADDLSAVRKFASGEVGEIRANVDIPSPRIWTIRQYRSNTAHTRALAILLSYHAPRDILTGQRIDVDRALAWQNSKEFHHFFPQAYLRDIGIDQNSSNCLSNIVMLTSESNKVISKSKPEEYLKVAYDSLGDDLMDVLQSNLISKEAFDAAMCGDYKEFLSIRSQSIHQAVIGVAQWV